MKLKPIPQNTVVHTPTEAEAKELLEILHENGWKWKTGHGLAEASHWTNEDTCYHIHPERKAATWDFVSECDGKVIFFSEFKERYCEMTEQLTEKTEDTSVIHQKPQPKFEVDDRVVIQESYYKEELHGQIGVVTGSPTPFSYSMWKLTKQFTKHLLKTSNPTPNPKRQKKLLMKT